MSRTDSSAISTRSIHAGRRPDPLTGAVVPPLYQSTTFAQAAVGADKGFTYSRAANPTVSALEEALGAVEDAPPCVAFASGLAATTTLFLTLLKSGDDVVVSDVVYGGTSRLLRRVLSGLGIRASFVDAAEPGNVGSAIGERTRLVFIETPGNPTLKLADIAAIARITKGAGVPLAVDNTFLTPVLQRPLELGADISLYSTTKHIEGHNSTIGGAITSRDGALLERLRFVRKTLGCIQSPFESWLTLRGLTTLPLRIRQHSENALVVARWLEAHPRVTRVNYPGLESFPQHELAIRQQKGFGGLLSFELEGTAADAAKVMGAVRVCTLAESLGAVETLITHPATMTHADVPAAERAALGISDGLIRLSVGLEDAPDIIADLERAIDEVFGSSNHKSGLKSRAVEVVPG